MLCTIVFPRTSKRLLKRILDIYAEGQETRSVDVPMSINDLQIDLPEKFKLSAVYVDAQGQAIQNISREFDLSKPNDRDNTTLNVYPVPIKKEEANGQVGTSNGARGQSGEMPVRGTERSMPVQDSVNLASKVSAPRVIKPESGGEEKTETVQDNKVSGSSE